MPAPFFVLPLVVPTALAGRITLEDARCDLVALGITEPGGTTYDPARGLAVVDHTDDRVRFLTADCVATGVAFSTAAYATNPRGIAWSEQLQEFAIVDPGTDELYYVSPAGARTGSCDLATLGSSGASGVAWDPLGQRYVVSDDQTSRIYFLNPTVRGGGTCARASDFSTANLGLNTPIEVAVDGDGNVLFARGSGLHSLYVTTPAGVLLEEIVLNADVQDIQGIVPDPALPDRFYVLDAENDDDLIHVDVRGTSTPTCTLLGGTPRGLAYVEATNQFLVADQGVDAIQVLDATSCVMQRSIAVAALGITAASDVAYLPASNEIAVVDEGTEDLYFLDAARGTLNSRCDLASQGLGIPRGLVALPDLDLVAVSGYEHRAWAVLDTSCAVVNARPLSFLAGEQAALPNADAIGWVPGSGRFLHAAGGMVFVSTFEGTPVIRFDTPGMNVTGMAADPSDPTAFWVQSYGNVERIVLPRLTEDPSISGRFGSATATVYLWDRGEGKVTGTALVGGDTLPLFGELSGGGGTLVMGTITGAGAPTIVSVTVSADLQTLTAPPPVGVLTRQ